MSRILAIDYGKKRTGIAVTDPAQIIAQGLTTVETSRLMPFLESYVSGEPVERFVVGLPRRVNGADSENADGARRFAERLRQKFPGTPVEMYDERFTSVLAHKTMLAGGLKKMERRNKALVDKISATLILQDFMESRRNEIACETVNRPTAE